MDLWAWGRLLTSSSGSEQARVLVWDLGWEWEQQTEKVEVSESDQEPKLGFE